MAIPPSIQSSNSSLADRIERLERETRTWKTVAAAVAGLMALWLAFTTSFAIIGSARRASDRRDIRGASVEKAEVQQSIADVIRTRRLEVVDENDQTRLVAAKDGEFMGVVIANEQGSNSLAIGVGPHASGAMFHGPEGIGVVTDASIILANAQGVKAGADLSKIDGNCAVRIDKGVRGGGRIQICNPDDVAVIDIYADKSDSGTIAVNAADGLPTTFLSSSGLLTDNLSVVNDAGNRVFSIGTIVGRSSGESTRMELLDGDGELRFAVTATKAYGIATLNGPAGAVSIANDGISVRPLRPENEAVRRSGISATATDEERRRYDDALVDPATVHVHAGGLDVYNPLGENVVSVQSNKGNDGAIYLKDATGNKQNSIGPRP